jgi:hypothetical protein
MKTVNGICKAFTSELVKVANHEEKISKGLVVQAKSLEKAAVASRAKAELHTIEANRADKAIAKIKDMFGVN